MLGLALSRRLSRVKRDETAKMDDLHDGGGNATS